MTRLPETVKRQVLISQAAYRYYKDPVLPSVCEFCSRNDDKQVRLTEFWHNPIFIMLFNQPFYLQKMGACLLNLTAPQLEFDERVFPVTEMQDTIRFQAISVMVV